MLSVKSPHVSYARAHRRLEQQIWRYVDAGRVSERDLLKLVLGELPLVFLQNVLEELHGDQKLSP